jgi:hypothetical protein
MINRNIFTELSRPFDQSDIEWRAGATNQDKTRALALAYITSRAVMDRLDEVVGPENWRDEYQPGPDGGLICGLSLRLDEEWITKWDGAENTLIEEVKGGLSGAYKRAAVKWGIGRYLYKLERVWVPCEMTGKSVVLKLTPPLPGWALPPNSDVRTQHISNIPEEVVGQKTPSRSEEEGNPSGEEVSDGIIAKEKQNRSISWEANVVKAVIAADLADNPITAVSLLNNSGLPKTSLPEEAVSVLRSN